MKKEMKKESKSTPVKRVKCDLLGDVHRLRYEFERRKMVADILLSPTEIRRLLDAMQMYYAGSKTKRRQRIFELAAELAKLIEQDCTFFVEGTAYIASGNAILMSNDADYLLENGAELDGPVD